MKNFFFLLLVLFTFLNAQEIQNYAEIELKNGEKIYVENVVETDDKISFTNYYTKTKEFLYRDSVTKINYREVFSNKEKEQIVSAEKERLGIVEANELAATTNINAPQTGELTFIRGSQFFLDGEKLSRKEVNDLMATNETANSYWKKAKTNSTVGGLFLGAGIGWAIGTGISNLSAANNCNSYNCESEGGPGGIIAGLVVSGASTIFLTQIRKNKVKAVEAYNAGQASNPIQTEINLVSTRNGLGLRLSF